AGWTTASTGFYVSSETSLLAAPSGPLVLVSAPVAEGTQVGLWSTATDSMVAGSTLVLEDQYHFLALDDGSSIAVARNASGEVHVLDAANGFATLHVLADWLGPVALDGHRELLFGVRDDAAVDIFDIRDGRILANVALEATVAPVPGIALAD